MKFDLIIRNGTVVTSAESFKADVGVSGGKIAFIGNIEYNVKADKVFDAEGLFVLPGVIDAHVHFREPGLTYKEDFETGSRAAAKGGITFFADMPNTIPPTSTVELLRQKLQIAKKKSCIDFGLFALLNNDNIDEIPKLVEAGALGFKVFLGTSTGDIACPKEEVLLEQLKISTKLGKRVGFHCETSEINEKCTLAIKEKNPRPIPPYGELLNDARPIESEVLAIEKALEYARKTNAMIHIHHVTCKQGIELIEKAKKEGIDVTAETCPHYLFLDAETSSHKVYPPIRGKEHRLALWEAVKSGVIDIIATDHAPHAAEEKALHIWEAPGGLAGVETFVNLLLNEVNNGTITLNNFVRLACTNPAKVWGLKNKGGIEIGKDADFTIVDIDKKVMIKAEEMLSKSKTSAYDGWELRGVAVKTIVSGRVL